MNIYWLEQTEADLPGMGTGIKSGAGAAQDDHTAEVGAEWLCARESSQVDALRITKRRAEWLLGRWTAKRAVAACLALPDDLRSLANIELRPAASGAPEIFFTNQPAPITVSLSHRAGRAVCAVILSAGSVGCDLETIEPRSDAFVADYFTAGEQALAARLPPADRPGFVTVLWSAKESALKALHTGLRLDTRSVIVTPFDVPGSQDEDESAPAEDDAGADFAARPMNAALHWRPLRVHHLHGSTFRGWWQQTSSLVRTVVAAPSPSRPVFLDLPRWTSKGRSASASQRSDAA